MPILCGTDLSDASADALAVARALAAQRGEAEVVLLHVIDPEHHTGDEDEARAKLEALARTAGEVTVRTELLVDVPDASITAYAETSRCDLIVIAARSRPGGSLIELGTTASRVIARTTIPVILVRDPAPWIGFAAIDRRRKPGRGEGPDERPLRVMIGIDESATCDLAIQWTSGLRERGPVEVVLGAIYYPDEAAAHYGLHARALVDRDPEIERLLERDLLRRFNGGPNVVARPRRGLGRIGDHLVELAREESVDVVVVGTSQKTGLGRLGSVSSVIVSDAPQSIVCVPPNAAVATTTTPTVRATLVATDLSPFANRAVPWAFSLTPDGGEVHLLHVVKADAEPDEADLRKQLLALAPVGAKHVVSAHIVHSDDAAVAIGQSAARLGVDLIAIASHGRSGISRALVGSVADRLLRATRTPVLVLRPPS